MAVTPSPLIVLNSVTKSYGKSDALIYALKDVTLSINPGEFVGVIGESGSGKSTLLNIIAGMDRLTSGKVLVNDVDLSTVTDKRLTSMRRDHIAFIFQFYNLIPTLTALENVVVAKDIARNPLDPVAVLEQVGLTAVQHHFPGEMSGGQQQRVAIARALVMNAPILLCDEPTGALDSKASLDIMRLIDQIHQQHGKTVIFVTHDDHVSKYADRLVRIVDGEVALFDSYLTL